MSIYKNALSRGLRFKAPMGSLSTEDLFNLSLEQLDEIAKAVNRKIKIQDEESFIEKKTDKANDEILKLDILKDIIATKLAYKERAEKAAITRAQNERIRELIAQKQDAKLAELSEEELKALLEE